MYVLILNKHSLFQFNFEFVNFVFFSESDSKLYKLSQAINPDSTLSVWRSGNPGSW